MFMIYFTVYILSLFPFRCILYRSSYNYKDLAFQVVSLDICSECVEFSS